MTGVSAPRPPQRSEIYLTSRERLCSLNSYVTENLWVRRNSAAALTRIPGGESSLHSALLGDDPYAADAATQALTDSGALTAARDRLDRDVATSLDRVLLERISDMGEVSV